VWVCDSRDVAGRARGEPSVYYDAFRAVAAEAGLQPFDPTDAFVEAARVSGASDMRILFVHVMPNILPLALVYGSISIGWAILTEASISFLGFGATDTVSWGTMLQDAYVSQALSRGWYRWFVPPGICIILIVVAGFFISRGFEEVFFPRLRD